MTMHHHVSPKFRERHTKSYGIHPRSPETTPSKHQYVPPIPTLFRLVEQMPLFLTFDVIQANLVIGQVTMTRDPGHGKARWSCHHCTYVTGHGKHRVIDHFYEMHYPAKAATHALARKGY